MRRVLLLLCAVALSIPTARLFADGGGDDLSSGAEPQRLSVATASYPGGPGAKEPLATGYYVVDNDAPQTGPPWAPNYNFIDTSGTELQFWHRIISGPKQRLASFWTRPESNGLEYFRNPNDVNDSTNNAFAGPISIGFPFYYYGRKYDSFYVSTNGLVALTNRRYQYDESGNRVDYESIFDDIRPKSGNPITDPARDDYGYTVVATGGTAGVAGTGITDGILNPNNNAFPQASLKSVLAPLWDDTELSQFDANSAQPDDFGKVYWRRVGGDQLVVYYVNQSMRGVKFIPILGTNANVNARAIRANYQVVLDRSDSTIQYNYVRFTGVYTDPTSNVINIPSNAMFRSNATIGIQSHDGEFTNYLSNADNGGAVFVNGSPFGTPHNALAIKFKQWRNIVRVLSSSFQTPSIFVPGTYVDLPPGFLFANYEILLGHPILGIIRPVGVVQNVSSDVGPVNITKQPIRFNVIFRIRDLVNVTNPPVYQRTAVTDSLFPIFGSNPITRANIDTIIFDPYITNPNVPRQLGRFRAEVIALDQTPDGRNYGQEWPFDDTTGITVFGIKRLEMPFINTFSDYDVSPEDGVIPSVKNWVSIGANVVDGESNTYNPPPPRGPVGPQQLNSPVCLMDRRDIGGGFYNNNVPGVIGGDTLISFPINLSQSVINPIMLLSYQRAGRQQNGYPRGFSDALRVGPEHSTYNTVKDGWVPGGLPDRMVVEFAQPSQDGLNGVVNIQSGWRTSQFGRPNDRPTWGAQAPRWGVFGGGGGSGQDTLGRIIVDEFDPGKDFEFSRAFIPVPTSWARANPGNRTFRFRVRVEAKMDGNPFGAPADDGDNFYLDNVMLVEPDKPEVEITAVRVDWPYSEAPASQARAIPLSVKIGNNGATAATTFGVAMYVENLTSPPPPGFYNYYRYQSIISIPAGRDRVENYPTWNAQECGANFKATPTTPQNTVTQTDYRISARVLPLNYDSYTPNDLSYTDFRLRLGPTFGYDDGSNDVQTFAQLVGRGLNLVPPSNQDGQGASPFGPSGGSSSGTFAMQFRILTRDTVRGFKAYYSGANQSQDFILYSIYKQPGGTSVNNPPVGLPIASTRAYARRGEGRADFPVAGRQFHFDQFVTYLLDTPYVAEPGTYFATVAQLGQTGLELGGDASRMAQVTTIRSDGPPVGVGNYSIAAHPEMRQNRFWYEVTTESGGWNPMITLTNNPGYPHLNWVGGVGPINTYTRGSWIPMIRPYFGLKNSSACAVEPVELASFEVTALSDALRLDWTTASEIKNHGFYVERRAKESEGEWADVAFQAGNGTTNRTHQYAYVDHSVVPNVTYQYRLRQEDEGGAVNYSSVKEGRLAGATAGAAVNTLAQNVPNPMNGSTRISFNVIESQPVTVEIVDVYGKTVKSFSLEAKAGGENAVDWDGRDASGAVVPNGAYVYKLVGNGFTLAKKLTVSR